MQRNVLRFEASAAGMPMPRGSLGNYSTAEAPKRERHVKTYYNQVTTDLIQERRRFCTLPARKAYPVPVTKQVLLCTSPALYPPTVHSIQELPRVSIERAKWTECPVLCRGGKRERKRERPVRSGFTGAKSGLTAFLWGKFQRVRDTRDKRRRTISIVSGEHNIALTSREFLHLINRFFNCRYRKSHYLRKTRCLLVL